MNGGRVLRWQRCCGAAILMIVLGGCSAAAPALPTAALTATHAATAPPSPSAPVTPSPPPPATVEPTPGVTVEPSPSFPDGAMRATEAAKKVGSVATVCGKVVTATYATTSRGKPTFLNLDRPFPNQVFTIVIWEEDRPAFPGAPEVTLINNWVCIEGLVEKFRSAWQMTSVGGDIYDPASFVPWPADALDCVRQGSHMTVDCETYLDVLIEIRVVEAEQAWNDYLDALDAQGDPYQYVPDPPYPDPVYP